MNVGKAFESQINALIQDVLTVAEKTALDAVRSAFGASPGATRPIRSRRRAEGRRRTAEDIRAMRDQLYAEISRNPGETMSVFAAALGATASELNLPARMLIRDGRVRTTGERNATRYFPMAG